MVAVQCVCNARSAVLPAPLDHIAWLKAAGKFIALEQTFRSHSGRKFLVSNRTLLKGVTLGRVRIWGSGVCEPFAALLACQQGDRQRVRRRRRVPHWSESVVIAAAPELCRAQTCKFPAEVARALRG